MKEIKNPICELDANYTKKGIETKVKHGKVFRKKTELKIIDEAKKMVEEGIFASVEFVGFD